MCLICFFKQKTAYELRISDLSSDVCSSDLSISAILIILPVLMPIALGYGIDPVQFGVMVALNLSIGLITPPYGICLFVAAMVSERKVEQVASRVWTMVIPMIIVLGSVAYVPEIVLTLPRLFSQ